MKRAWPYAVALAVVVTGCYLLLAPLLRSLSPAPTTSASQLSQGSNSTTVGKAPTIIFRSPNHGATQFASALTTKKKAKKAKKTRKPTLTTPSTGFAGNTTSTSSSGSSSSGSSSSSSTPSTPKTPAKKPSSSTGAANKPAIGGKIDQSQAGTGFAGTGNDAPVTGGSTLTPGS
jgi:hypothetical protein